MINHYKNLEISFVLVFILKFFPPLFCIFLDSSFTLHHFCSRAHAILFILLGLFCQPLPPFSTRVVFSLQQIPSNLRAVRQGRRTGIKPQTRSHNSGENLQHLCLKKKLYLCPFTRSSLIY